MCKLIYICKKKKVYIFAKCNAQTHNLIHIHKKTIFKCTTKFVHLWRTNVKQTLNSELADQLLPAGVLKGRVIPALQSRL